MRDECGGGGAGESIENSGAASLPVRLSTRGLPTMSGEVRKPPSLPTPMSLVLSLPSRVSDRTGTWLPDEPNGESRSYREKGFDEVDAPRVLVGSATLIEGAGASESGKWV
jgi:hypothetical protein